MAPVQLLPLTVSSLGKCFGVSDQFPPVKDNLPEAPLSSVLSPLPGLGGSPWGLQPVWGGEAGLGRVA